MTYTVQEQQSDGTWKDAVLLPSHTGWDVCTFSTKREAEVYAYLWTNAVTKAVSQERAPVMELGKPVGFRHNHVKPDTVYEVVGYSHYPNIGEGPQVRCEDGSLGDVPMSNMDYDIVSIPDKSNKFNPIILTLETYQEVQNLIKLCGGYDVATELTRILATHYSAVS